MKRVPLLLTVDLVSTPVLVGSATEAPVKSIFCPIVPSLYVLYRFRSGYAVRSAPSALNGTDPNTLVIG